MPMLSDLVHLAQGQKSYKNLLYCDHLKANQLIGEDRAVYLNVLIQVLVISGSTRFWVNGREFIARENDLILLSPTHLLEVVSADSHFECVYLVAERRFLMEIAVADRLNTYVSSKSLYFNPVVTLSEADAVRVLYSMGNVQHRIQDVQHAFRGDVLWHALAVLYYDLLQALQNSPQPGNGVGMREVKDKELVINLINLLIDNFQTEHHTGFYAEKLNMSPQNLNLIVKRVLNTTVSKMIYELLYSRARNLLVYSTKNINQIADELNFSDQAAFGKFFKKKSGHSPRTFRKLFAQSGKATGNSRGHFT